MSEENWVVTDTKNRTFSSKKGKERKDKNTYQGGCEETLGWW